MWLGLTATLGIQASSFVVRRMERYRPRMGRRRYYWRPAGCLQSLGRWRHDVLRPPDHLEFFRWSQRIIACRNWARISGAWSEWKHRRGLDRERSPARHQ